MGEKVNNGLKALLAGFMDELCEDDDHEMRVGVATEILPPGYKIVKVTDDQADASR